jgi:hypothetical protein
MSAAALTSRGAGWAEQTFNADPAALDAAMQLAVLWTNRKVDGLALPLAVSEFRTFGPIDAARVDLVLRGRSANKSRTITDVDLVDEGRLVATLRGVEVYRYRTVS